MTKTLTRIGVIAALVAAFGATVFVQAASANYLGGASITCSGASFDLSTFPAGQQDVLETVFVDGVIAAQVTYSFTGPAGSNTLAFAVPNDGNAHSIEANAYSLTNSTPVFGLPAVASLTCGSSPPPPPPPPSVCTYTKGYYRNHASATATVIAGMGGSIKLGSASLSAVQAQAVLNATPGSPLNVMFGGNNLLLNMAQQLISAELNLARGSAASAAVTDAIAQANGGITVALAGGQITIGTSLGSSLSSLVSTVEGFNSATDCS